MDYKWPDWLKNWRRIADKSSTSKYVTVHELSGGTWFEVLRVSKYHAEYDGDRAFVETAIREFNDKTALHSRATRDLGLVRVITSNRKPAFVVEPGADVLDYRASTQGVSVKALMSAVREGDLGRRIRQRDRTLAKNRQSMLQSRCKELEFAIQEGVTRVAELEQALAETQRQRDLMRQTIVANNENGLKRGEKFPVSAPMSNALQTAIDRNIKLKSTKRLPGSYR